ncbi:hypothetical protein A0J61_08437 [Choanephora cucurbitarum]|uniref:Integrase catalytic domain-containing protein n=1 Tax=Choanephora cucurbitarum TaxID=101091 RepID=A0A1C7N315_9FUNG|nr:hypothetical protein A0J61_08437 [Choanephora cucurbitarum]
MQDHTAHVKSVIDELTRVKLILSPAKCHFAQRAIYLLGFCVSANGQAYLGPRNITNTMEWPTPRTAEAVVQALIPVFCDLGIPRIVQSDNGKEFANQVMERFRKSTGFDHRLITPYYPQANGPAERTVGTAMNTIKKVVEGVTGEWDLFVYSVQLAINNKVSKRLNTPPLNVMFSRRLNDFKNYNEETGTTTPLIKEQADQRIKEL